MSEVGQMLDRAASFTASAYQAVNESMNKQLAIRQHVMDSETDLRMKGLQFAENQRMNDANITNMNLTNNLRAKEHAFKMAMAPLEFETANLRLQATKFSFEKEKERIDTLSFNEITKDYDDYMGMTMLQSRNTDHMKSYIDHKAKWKNHVLSGGQFDPTEYKKGLNNINSKFEGVAPERKDYSPEFSFMLGKISPVSQQRYENENPLHMSNKNALSSSIITSTAAGFSEAMAQHGNKYIPEEVSFLATARSIYSNNQDVINGSIEQASRLTNQMALAKTDEQRATLSTLLESTNKKIVEKMTQNEDLITGAAMGTYNLDAAIVLKPPNEDKRPSASNYPPTEETVLKVKKEDYINNSDDTAFIKRIQDISEILGSPNPDETEIGLLDMRWYAESLRKDNPDTRTLGTIKSKIEDRMEALGDIGKRFNEKKVNELLSTITRDTDIPISNYLANLIKDTGIGTRSESIKDQIINFFDPKSDKEYQETPKISFKYTKSDAGIMQKAMSGGLDSYDKINSLLRRIPDKTDREQARDEIFATLITAAMSNAIKE